MKVYGTTTSPFVRRVRVVGLELGLPLELVDTRAPGGAELLRAVTPLWKVPVLARDGREPLFDSRAIVAMLLREHGPGPLRLADDPDADANLQNAIDGALDALVNVYAIEGGGGIDVDRVPYLVKQKDRAAAALRWVAERLRGPWTTAREQLGASEIALQTALDWMVFRGRFPVDDDPRLAAFRAFHASRPSFAATAPRA